MSKNFALQIGEQKFTIQDLEKTELGRQSIAAIDGFILADIKEIIAAKRAAATLGSIRSAKKTAAARRNAQKPRPRK